MRPGFGQLGPNQDCPPASWPRYDLRPDQLDTRRRHAREALVGYSTESLTSRAARCPEYISDSEFTMNRRYCVTRPTVAAGACRGAESCSGCSDGVTVTPAREAIVELIMPSRRPTEPSERSDQSQSKQTTEIITAMMTGTNSRLSSGRGISVFGSSFAFMVEAQRALALNLLAADSESSRALVRQWPYRPCGPFLRRRQTAMGPVVSFWDPTAPPPR